MAPDGAKEPLRSTNEGIPALVKTKDLVGGARNADADSFSDWSGRTAGFAQPERAGGAKVETVVAAIDLKSGGEASRAAREIEKLASLAVALHELDAIEGLECADQDGRCDSSRLAHDIQHEVRAVIEKNVGVAGGEVHRTDARSRAAEMMSGGIAGRISFRFHDAAA